MAANCFNIKDLNASKGGDAVAAVTAAFADLGGNEGKGEIEAQIIALRDQLNSPDEQVCVQAAAQIRKMLSKEHTPPIDAVLGAGILPRLIHFLQADSNPTLQFEAAWAITNIVSGSSEHARCVVEQGAIPIFVRLLASPSEDVSEQAVWALGNIAGDSVPFRDAVLDAGAIPAFLGLAGNVTAQARASKVRNCAWAILNLCRGKPRPNFDKLIPVLPLLIQIVNGKDTESVGDASWALSYLLDGPNELIAQVVATGVAARLVELLDHQASSVQMPALRAVGNILTGNDVQTQAILNLNVVPALARLLDHPKKGVRKEACWSLSNITAGTPEQIQIILNEGVFPKLIRVLNVDEADIKKEAAWAISNATSGGNPGQLLAIARLGCIAPLCRMLSSQDGRAVLVALEGLDNFLKAGRRPEQLTLEIEDEVRACGGASAIEGLQNGPHDGAQKRASDIWEAYFAGRVGEGIPVWGDYLQS
jgi:importin subunit alpha-1